MSAFGGNMPGSAPVAQTPDFIGAAKNKAQMEAQMLAAKRLRQTQTMQGAASAGTGLYKATGYNPIEAGQYGYNAATGNTAGNEAIAAQNKAQVKGWEAAEIAKAQGQGGNLANAQAANAGSAKAAGGGGMNMAGGQAANVAAGQQAGLLAGGAGQTAASAAGGAGITGFTPATAAAAQGFNMAGGLAGAGGVGTAATGAGTAAGTTAATTAAATTAGTVGGTAAVGGGTAAAGGMMAAAGPVGWAALAALAAYGLMSA